MSILCFQLKEIPDLTLNKYQSLANTGANGVLNRHEDFLRQWHGICISSQVSIHLLYVYDPDAELGRRLLTHLILLGEESKLQLVKPLLQYSPLSDFYTFHESLVPNIHFNAGATLTKKERIAEIFHSLAGETRSFHYVPKWDVASDCRLYDLFRTLEAIGKSYSPHPTCAFRVDLYPATTEVNTRASFSPVIKDLHGDNDITIMREAQSRHDNYSNDIVNEYTISLNQVFL